MMGHGMVLCIAFSAWTCMVFLQCRLSDLVQRMLQLSRSMPFKAVRPLQPYQQHTPPQGSNATCMLAALQQLAAETRGCKLTTLCTSTRASFEPAPYMYHVHTCCLFRCAANNAAGSTAAQASAGLCPCLSHSRLRPVFAEGSLQDAVIGTAREKVRCPGLMLIQTGASQR